MKVILWCILFFFVRGQLAAQQEYFVFIQQPAGQPFYVRIGEDVHSSSASGHLILPSLKDSVYGMYVGFPKATYTEQLFNVEVSRKDRGFELKNVNGRWQLVDLQSQQPLNPAVVANEKDTGRKTDTYSMLMAGVVDDSAVLYTSVRKQQEIIEAEKSEEEINDEPVTNKEVPADTSVAKAGKGEVKKKEEVQPAEQKWIHEGRDRRDIIRFSSENIVEGKLVIYVDRSGPVNDTIRIIIPKL